MTVEDRLRDVVSDMIGINKERIQNDSYFIEDLGCDSLDTVEILMSVEEEFGFEISDEEGERIKTFGQAVEFLKSKGVKDSEPPPVMREITLTLDFTSNLKSRGIDKMVKLDEVDLVRQELPRWIKDNMIRVKFDIRRGTATVLPAK